MSETKRAAWRCYQCKGVKDNQTVSKGSESEKPNISLRQVRRVAGSVEFRLFCAGGLCHTPGGGGGSRIIGNFSYGQNWRFKICGMGKIYHRV